MNTGKSIPSMDPTATPGQYGISIEMQQNRQGYNMISTKRLCLLFCCLIFWAVDGIGQTIICDTFSPINGSGYVPCVVGSTREVHIHREELLSAVGISTSCKIVVNDSNEFPLQVRSYTHSIFRKGERIDFGICSSANLDVNFRKAISNTKSGDSIVINDIVLLSRFNINKRYSGSPISKVILPSNNVLSDTEFAPETQELISKIRSSNQMEKLRQLYGSDVAIGRNLIMSPPQFVAKDTVSFRYALYDNAILTYDWTFKINIKANKYSIHDNIIGEVISIGAWESTVNKIK